MRSWTSLLLCLLLAACANAPPVTPRPDHLFDDALFGAPSERIAAEDVFALSDAMKRYLQEDIAQRQRRGSKHGALLEALYTRGQLKLEYDAAMTRNAAQAFEARAGNCLSLVIMTAAFAKELGLAVEFQSATREETWSRSGDLLFRTGHVNVTIARPTGEPGIVYDTGALTVDFLPPEELRGLRTVVIAERTVLAMFMNNRAAEALAAGRLDDAYAWVREAIRQDPEFMSAYNTLGIVYLRGNHLAHAERALARLLAREPANTRAMSNLAEVYRRQGRTEAHAALAAKLAEIEPYPPFHFFHLGRAAMERGDFAAARALFAREVARDGYYHEFHFWLALANYRLGAIEQAKEHLTLAMKTSPTRQDQQLYAGKVAWMKGLRSQH